MIKYLLDCPYIYIYVYLSKPCPARRPLSLRATPARDLKNQLRVHELMDLS